MAKAKPAFIHSGYCRECGQHTYINAAARCENCWLELQRQKRKERRARKSGSRSLSSLLRPYVERLQAGEKPQDVFVSLLVDAGYDVKLR